MRTKADKTSTISNRGLNNILTLKTEWDIKVLNVVEVSVLLLKPKEVEFTTR